MSYETKLAIFNKIKEYDRIFLFRHIRMDGDCTGATKGLKEILKISFPEKEVYIEANYDHYSANKVIKRLIG